MNATQKRGMSVSGQKNKKKNLKKIFARMKTSKKKSSSLSTRIPKQNRRKLNKIIGKMPGLAKDLKAKKIDLARESDIYIFGYGSLPRKPHYTPSHRFPALLKGFRKDFNCCSISAGTPSAPGLTLGLTRETDSYVAGINLCYRNLSMDEKIDMLAKFASREALPTGIYEFKMQEVLQHDGSTVYALTCIANEDTKHFVGDALCAEDRRNLSPEDQSQLSILKKAQIIAQASGHVGTNKSYLDRFVAYDLLNTQLFKSLSSQFEKQVNEEKVRHALFQSEQYMRKLVQAVNEFRAQMSPARREKLEAMEEIQWNNFIAQQKKNQDTALFFHTGITETASPA